jgi:hypothetical protein
MAFVKSIEPMVGESANSDDTISLYVNLKKQNLVYTGTTLDINGDQLPIGFFNEDEMDLFREGIRVLFLVNNGSSYTVLTKEQQQAENEEMVSGYIEDLLLNYHSAFNIIPILDAFDSISQKYGHRFVTPEQIKYVQGRIQNLEKLEHLPKNCNK